MTSSDMHAVCTNVSVFKRITTSGTQHTTTTYLVTFFSTFSKNYRQTNFIYKLHTYLLRVSPIQTSVHIFLPITTYFLHIGHKIDV